jgi:predicted nucleic acid-binding protein
LINSAAIPAGSSCVLDTNVMLYAHQQASTAATEVLRRCAAGDLIGILPSAVWEELCHRLMVAEAVATGRILAQNPARKRAEHRETVQELGAYRWSLQELAAMGLRFEPVHRDDVLRAALDLQKRYGLLTNDSIIAACAMRLGVQYLVTSDTGFLAVTELGVALLEDLVAA